MIKNTCLSLVLLLAAISLCSCAPSATSTQHPARQSTYDRVIQSGKIRCGYVVYPPGCIKDPNTGRLSGIGVEAIESIGKKLGLAVEWTEEIGWGTMLEGLETGRYDMVATPVWTNANRAKVISFSNPLFYSPVFVFARKGDHRFKNHWEKINNPTVKISTVDGGTVEVIAAADFPKAKRFSMPEMTDISQLLLTVAGGKADVTFAESTIADRYMLSNPGTIENTNPGKPIRVFASSWILRRGELEFKAMLDTVLDEVVNSGALDKIISKYEKAPHEIYRLALPYQLPR
jgi:polar amino acid transport system substrate-binding protein